MNHSRCYVQMRRSTLTDLLRHHRANTGFTLLEVMVTIAIIGVLTMLVQPRFAELLIKSKVNASQAKLTNIEQAFVTFFWEGLISGGAQFPPTPPDSLMSRGWSNSNVLINGKNPGSLFSTGFVPLNPLRHPYIYFRLEPDTTQGPGFSVRDPDYNITRILRL